jgi:hypothetical protein
MVRPRHPRQRFRGAGLEKSLDRAPFGLHFDETQLFCTFPRDDDDVDTGGDELRPQTKALAAQPLHAIATHGAPNLSGHDEAEPRRGTRRGASWLRRYKQREVLRTHAATEPLRAYELRVPAQPALLPEVERHYFL